MRLPEGLKRLYAETFDRCESLEQIELPASLQEIGSGGVPGCAALRKVVISQWLEGIGSWAFSDCRSLKQIELPPKAKILSSAFSGCAFREVFVPNGVLLDSEAFYKMPDLERIIIDGDNIFCITQFGKEELKTPTRFFDDCPNLRDIIFTQTATMY